MIRSEKAGTNCHAEQEQEVKGGVCDCVNLVKHHEVLKLYAEVSCSWECRTPVDMSPMCRR